MRPFLPTLLVVLTSAGVLGACAGAPPMLQPYRETETPAAGRDSPRGVDIEATELEIQALLVLLADRRQYEGFTIERAFNSSSVSTREMLAKTLGAVANPNGLDTLKALLLDSAPEVRRRAAFSLGRLGDAGAVPNLLAATVDPDRETGRQAVEAAARLGSPVLPVGERLAEVDQDEFWARLLPGLFRFDDEAIYPLARLGLQQVSEPELRAAAVYALAHRPLPAVAGDLRQLVEDRDPQIRAWAAAGLGRVGAAEDLELMQPLLEDREPGPVIQALGAGRRLVATGFAAPIVEWRRPLRQLLEDLRPGVRLAAIETAALWLLDEDLEGPLIEMARSGAVPYRAAALASLARAAHPRAAELAAEAAVEAGEASSPDLRAAAARAADLLDAPEILQALADDPDPKVRVEVLQSWLQAVAPVAGTTDPSLAVAVVREALEDQDAALRATVYDWLVLHPVLAAEELALAVAAGNADRTIEPYLSGVQALGARAAYLGERLAATPSEIDPARLAWLDERRAAIKALKDLGASSVWLIRRQAAVTLGRLGEEPAPVGPQETGKVAATYEDVLLRTRQRPRLRLITERGALTLELDCPEAPLSCLSFLQLAQQGFFDGLSFHRRVPDLLVQGGDPRGNGWGGPGYTLRDELSPRPFRRGSVGLARSAPDTAGSQFFLTLSPQPRLTGEYTHLGTVVEGDEILSALLPGDRIERIEIGP